MTNQLAPNLSAFAAQVRDFIHRHSMKASRARTTEHELEFEGMARGLFQIQYQNNAHYRQFCQARKVAPESVKSWR